MDNNSDHQNTQACPICLECLLPKNSVPATVAGIVPVAEVQIGAVNPCGHCFHTECYRKWHAAQERRRRRNRRNNGEDENGDARCKCPMCNNPCDDFVKLYLGGDSRHSRSSEATTESAAAATSTAISSTGGDDDTTSESILLLARTCHDSAKRLDRVKDKLDKYKKENRSLEKKLEDERKHMDSTLERAVERHSKERRSWKRQQHRLQDEVKEKEEAHEATKQELEKVKEEIERERRKWRKYSKKMEQKLAQEKERQNEEHLSQAQEWGRIETELKQEVEQARAENHTMQQEIDRTIELQVEERRGWEQQQKLLQEELEKARADKLKAEAQVAKAVQGIAQMRVFHEMRKDHVTQLHREKVTLVQQLRELQEEADLDEEIVFE